MKLPFRLDWRAAATFVCADPDWGTKIFRGGLLLLFPPLGWPVALGYRKVLIGRLATRAEPVLPDWEGNVLRFWREGMQALGIIFLHYSPVFVLYVIKVARHGAPDLPWVPWMAFFAFFLLLTPFLLPALVIASSEWAGGSAFRAGEVLGVLAYFALATFLIPAAFLQVSRTGRYLSAFHWRASLGLVVRHFRLYLEAWTFSCSIALVGHFCIPFSPWGVFWCYQSIVYSFNEIRMHTGEDVDRALLEGRSWFREPA